MKNISKFLRMGLIVFALVFVVAPNVYAQGVDCATAMGPFPKGHPCDTSSSSSSASSSASASTRSSGNSGSIFTILETKIYNTLMDLRQIIYVIAGFGLVMFAVMAIFNKISYKHLGYIMIGLSLLALLFPFIEYFSGYTTEALRQQRELTFRSFIDPKISMQRVQGTSYQEIENPEYDGSIPEEEIQAQLEAEKAEQERRMQELKELRTQWAINMFNDGGGLALSGDNLDIAEDVLKAAGCDPNAQSSKSSWNTKTGLRNVCVVDPKTGKVYVQKEVCQGKFNADGTCSKTFMQTVGDVWATAQNGIGLWNNLSKAASSGADVFANIGAAGAAAGNIINGNGTFLDKLNGLSNLGQITSDTVSGNFNSMAGWVAGGAQNVGNTAGIWSTNPENNPYGANGITDAMTILNQNMYNMQNNVGAASSTFNSYAGVGNALYGAGQNIDAGSSTWSSGWSKFTGLFH